MSTMLDGNTAALSSHESSQDSRQKSYDSLLPEAIEILKERLLGERDTKGRQLGLFALAEHLLNNSSHLHWLLNEEFIANLITEHYNKGDNTMLRSPVTIYTDGAIEEIINSERGQQELEDIVTELEEDNES